jgi:predicted enzyme related to lactoylglutathione lyase
MPEIAFQRTTPVLKSGDYPRSRAFYVEVLGYGIAEEGGDPPRFGIFERGGSVLFIDAWHGAAQPVAGTWDAYIHVSGLEALFAELEASSAPITRPIEDTVYGMREFEVTDPDGNVLCFGEDADPAATG